MENPNGSKPTSPGEEPSSLGGRSKNGTEGLASMEKRAFVAGAVLEERRTPAKEVAGATAAPPKAETKAYIVWQKRKVIKLDKRREAGEEWMKKQTIGS